MGTRAATFDARLRALRDYHHRVQNNVAPVPTGTDISNTLKHFTSMLLGILKDSPPMTITPFGIDLRDSARLSVLPTLDYTSLYNVLLSIADVLPAVTNGKYEVCEALLAAFQSVLLFLDGETNERAVYDAASLCATFPRRFHRQIVALLCETVIPLVLGARPLDSACLAATADGAAQTTCITATQTTSVPASNSTNAIGSPVAVANPSNAFEVSRYALDSFAGALMCVLEHVRRADIHAQLVETMMSRKANLAGDLLLVAASGTSRARAIATTLLFTYLPDAHPNLAEARTTINRHTMWKATLCQRVACPNRRQSVAMRMVLDARVCIESADRAPPVYVCLDCADVLKLNDVHSPSRVSRFFDLVLPIREISTLCEKKPCSSSNKLAYTTCFSIECVRSNGCRPIRFCRSCYHALHTKAADETPAESVAVTVTANCLPSGTGAGTYPHAVQCAIPDLNEYDPIFHQYLPDAIVALLKEATAPPRNGKRKQTTRSSKQSKAKNESPTKPTKAGDRDGPNGPASASETSSSTSSSSASGGSSDDGDSSSGDGSSDSADSADDAARRRRRRHAHHHRKKKKVAKAKEDSNKQFGNKQAGALNKPLASGPAQASGGKSRKKGGQVHDRIGYGPITSAQRKLMTKFGIWLLVEKVKPIGVGAASSATQPLGVGAPSQLESIWNVPQPILCRLIAALFSWFEATVYITNDAVGSSLEALKSEYVCRWLQQLAAHDAATNLTQTIVTASLPYPPEYARVGACWDSLLAFEPPSASLALRRSANVALQQASARVLTPLEQGLTRLFALVPYDIVNVDAWNRLMPYWLETVCDEVATLDELNEVGSLLRKITDSYSMSVPAEKLFAFLDARFRRTTLAVQAQALRWIDCLSALKLALPTSFLLRTLANGVSCFSPVVDRQQKLEPLSSALLIATANNDEYQQYDDDCADSLLCDTTSESSEDRFDDEVMENEHPEKTGDRFRYDSGAVKGERKCSRRRRRRKTADADGVPSRWYATRAYRAAELLSPRTDLPEMSSFAATSSANFLQNAFGGAYIHDPRIGEPERTVIYLTQLVDVVRKQMGLQDAKAHDGFSSEPNASLANLLLRVFIAVPTSRLRHTCGLTVSCECDGEQPGTEKHSGATGSEKRSATLSLSSEKHAPAARPSTTQSGNPSPSPTPSHSRTATDSACADLSEADAYECEACQSLASLYAKANELLEFIASREPIATPEMELPFIDERTFRESRSRILLEGETADANSSSNTNTNGNGKQTERPERKTGRDRLPVEPANLFETDWPVTLKLLWCVVKIADIYDDPNLLYQVFRAINSLCVHGDALRLASAQPALRDVLEHALDRLVVRIWNTLKCGFSLVTSLTVPLFLYCITFECAFERLWQLVEAGFASTDWHARFVAVERVGVLFRHCTVQQVKQNCALMNALAHSFCALLDCLLDANVAVSQRTFLLLDTLPQNAFRAAIKCIESQFDLCVHDRALLLDRVTHLWHAALTLHATAINQVLVDVPIGAASAGREHEAASVSNAATSTANDAKPSRAAARRDVTVLNWDFFLNRFDTLAIEAQLDLEVRGELAYATDLSHTNRDSDAFQKKLNRCRFALICADREQLLSATWSRFCRPLTDSLAIAKTCGGGQSRVRRGVAAPAGASTRLEARPPPGINSEARGSQGGSSNLRLSAMATLRGAKLSNSSLQAGARGDRDAAGRGSMMREFTDGESSFAALLNRAIDELGSNRAVVHQLASLLLKFVARADQNLAVNSRTETKAQSTVLKHVATLLGYNATAKTFAIPPARLRCAAVFHAFLSNVARVLDRNIPLGNQLLHLTLALLQYAPSPQRYASDYQPPTYTLYLLESYTRHCWLRTLIVVLYKYNFDNATHASTIETLIRIALNTIAATEHVCKIDEDDDAFPLAQNFMRSRGSSPPKPNSAAMSRKSAITGANTPNCPPGERFSHVQSDGKLPTATETPAGVPRYLKKVHTATVLGGATTSSTSKSAMLLGGSAESVEVAAVKLPASIAAAAPATVAVTTTATAPPPPPTVSAQNSQTTQSLTVPVTTPVFAPSSTLSLNLLDDDTRPSDSVAIRKTVQRQFKLIDAKGLRVQSTSNLNSECNDKTSKDNQAAVEATKQTVDEKNADEKPAGVSNKQSDESSVSNKLPTPSKLPSCATKPKLSIDTSAPPFLDATGRASDPNTRAEDQLDDAAGQSRLPTLEEVVQEHLLVVCRTQRFGSLQGNAEPAAATAASHGESDEAKHRESLKSSDGTDRSDNTEGDHHGHTELNPMHVCTEACDDALSKCVVGVRPGETTISSVTTRTTTTINTCTVSVTTTVTTTLEPSKRRSVSVVMAPKLASFENQLSEVDSTKQRTLSASLHRVSTPNNVEEDANSDAKRSSNGLLAIAPRSRSAKRAGSTTGSASGDEDFILFHAENQRADSVNGKPRVTLNLSLSGNTSPTAARAEESDALRKGGLSPATVSNPDEQPEVGREREERSTSGGGSPAGDVTVTLSTVNLPSGPPARSIDALLVDRCMRCQSPIEQYDEETIALCIIALSAFVQRASGLAAPLLLEMLKVVARHAQFTWFSWQRDHPNIVVPGSSNTVARQFLRCILAQLAPHGLFLQLFQSSLEDSTVFFRVLVTALSDFDTHMTAFTPLEMALKEMVDQRALPTDSIKSFLDNCADYLEVLNSELSRASNMANAAAGGHAHPFATDGDASAWHNANRSGSASNSSPAVSPSPNQQSRDVSPTGQTNATVAGAVTPTGPSQSQQNTTAASQVSGTVSVDKDKEKEKTVDKEKVDEKANEKERDKDRLIEKDKEKISVIEKEKSGFASSDKDKDKPLAAAASQSPTQAIAAQAGQSQPINAHADGLGAGMPLGAACLAQLTSLLELYEALLRRLVIMLPMQSGSTQSLLRTMSLILRTPAVSQTRLILEPFSKLLAHTVQNGAFSLTQIVRLCAQCIRVFTKDRDRLYLTRTLLFELIQALKFRSPLPDDNLLTLIHFVLLDAGGHIDSADLSICDALDESDRFPAPPNNNTSEGTNRSPKHKGRNDPDIFVLNNNANMNIAVLSMRRRTIVSVGTLPSCLQYPHAYSTGAAECLRHNLNDCIEFLSDLHTMNKIKQNTKAASHNLREDTIGSHLKSCIAQYVALEFSKDNARNDRRLVQRHLPWLDHPPPAMQQGPKEFLDSVEHIRLLAWILIGSITQLALSDVLTQAKERANAGANAASAASVDGTGPPTSGSTIGASACTSTAFPFTVPLLSGAAQLSAIPFNTPSPFAMEELFQPIPIDTSAHIADHVMVIMTGFVEQSKTSVLHMSSLFHAFILCQLWTMYCELLGAISPPDSSEARAAMFSILDFWSRVTPGLLQLLSHTKVLAEMVSLHFVSLMEALQECNSAVLSKLMAMWIPLFHSHKGQVSGNLQVRLQTCLNWKPPAVSKRDAFTSVNSSNLLKWIKRLQFKLGQIEVQSSFAAQFYTI